MIRTVIIDDEENAVANIRSMLEKYCEGIEIAGTCVHPRESAALIREVKPQLVFLDIEMPFCSGFEVLENIPDKNFMTVFITAYGHYAIRAIKYSAFDYLLKPVDIDELAKTVEKARNHVQNHTAAGYAALMENVRGERPKSLCLSTQESNVYIYLDQVVYMQGEGGYTRIFTTDGNRYMVSKGLAEYEKLLQPEDFYRPHQSYLINLQHVKRYIKKDGGYIEMTNGAMIILSRRNKEGFVQVMSGRSRQ